MQLQSQKFAVKLISKNEIKNETVENHTLKEFTLIKIVFKFVFFNSILLSLEYCFSEINYKIHCIML